MAAFRALLGGLALLSSADLCAVHQRAIEAAEVAQARGGRVHFDEEMVPGNEGVILRQARVAIGRATEDEGVVFLEDEGFALHRPVSELEVNFAEHGWERRESGAQDERKCHRGSENGFGEWWLVENGHGQKSPVARA